MGKNFQADIQAKLAAAIEADRARILPQLPPGMSFDAFKGEALAQHTDRVAADEAKRKKRNKAIVTIAVAAAVAPAAAKAVAKAVGGAAVGSVTRRANPQPQPANTGFHPADTMIGQPVNPTKQMYGVDPKRPPGLIEKFIGAIWRIVVPTPR